MADAAVVAADSERCSKPSLPRTHNAVQPFSSSARVGLSKEPGRVADRVLFGFFGAVRCAAVLPFRVRRGWFSSGFLFGVRGPCFRRGIIL